MLDLRECFLNSLHYVMCICLGLFIRGFPNLVKFTHFSSYQFHSFLQQSDLIES